MDIVRSGSQYRQDTRLRGADLDRSKPPVPVQVHFGCSVGLSPLALEGKISFFDSLVGWLRPK